MGSVTRIVRQPVLWVGLGLTALYIALILLFVANFDGGCRESYPGSCQVLELDPPGLLTTVFLLAVVAVAAGICAVRPRSVARGALLAALGAGVVAIMVLGFELSTNPVWDWRY